MKKNRWVLHRNATRYLEQILKATSHETIAIRPLTSLLKTIQVRWTRYVGHCWRSEKGFIGEVLLWTPTHGRASFSRPARTYSHQFCTDTGCSLEDLPETMVYRDGWRERERERESGKSVLSAWLDDDDDDSFYCIILWFYQTQ